MVKTIFIPCRSKADISAVVESILRRVPFKCVGLVTTTQFIDDLPQIKERLESVGKRVIISPGRPNPGQILGCDAGAARDAVSKGAECVVYIGTGRFHPTRACIETATPIFMAHPKGGIERLPDDYLVRYRKIKAARIDKFNRARVVGIMVSTKPSQCRIKQALELKESIDKEGKKAFIIAGNELKPEYLLGYKVDVWVNTGCPRIAEDSFDVPVVDIGEISFK
jgi:diphthamide biosynthesis enzyme Dph1/Dph2-like protein